MRIASDLNILEFHQQSSSGRRSRFVPGEMSLVVGGDRKRNRESKQSSKII